MTAYGKCLHPAYAADPAASACWHFTSPPSSKKLDLAGASVAVIWQLLVSVSAQAQTLIRSLVLAAAVQVRSDEQGESGFHKASAPHIPTVHPHAALHCTCASRMCDGSVVQLVCSWQTVRADMGPKVLIPMMVGPL